jgi:hypothetical protein
MSTLKNEITTKLKELRRQAGFEPSAWYEEQEEKALSDVIDRVEDKKNKNIVGHFEIKRMTSSDTKEVGYYSRVVKELVDLLKSPPQE